MLSARVAGLFGAEVAAAVHCVAAAITVAVAAVMTGEAPERVAALPDASGMPNRVVIPAGHVVDYGHSILTAICFGWRDTRHRWHGAALRYRRP